MQFERKLGKKKAKETLKKHYFLFVFLCLVAAMIGTEYASSYSELSNKIVSLTGYEKDDNVNSRWNINEAITNAMDKNAELSQDMIDSLVNQSKSDQAQKIGNHIQIGYTKGVFAQIRDSVVSGAFIIAILISLTHVFGSSSAAVFIFVIIAFLIIGAMWIFFVNVYKVIYARMFLEGRTYKRVPLQRIAFLLYVRKWINAALTMCLEAVYYNLWCLTIVGGVVKFFSYFAVPYIVAENPGIKPKEAIRLSRRMMDGHKWECFKLHFTFIGWSILDIITCGISGILYSNPYMSAVLCEYYAYIRKMAKEKNIEGIEALNDIYLFEVPSREAITDQYGEEELYAIATEAFAEPKERKDKIGDFFGIYFSEEKNNEDNRMKKEEQKYKNVRYVLDGEEYGLKFFPTPISKRRNVLELLGYDRKYSIWTLILFFVFFSFCGWVWEMSLHLFQDGCFVNRGILHGPYLPIYGTGGVLILIFLKKFRKNPALEFLSAMLLCGFVEYFGGFMMETLHNGKKWWNYSGYFINIDGRVCAEGLLVFGLGGMIVVYFVAPLFDNFVKRFSKQIIVTLSIVLVVIMAGDMAFSSKHPNTGKGITTSYNIEWVQKEQIARRN